MYNPLGAFADTDNLGNAYAFAWNRPTVAGDPYGLMTWEVDEEKCTITLRVKLRLEFKGFESAFEEMAAAQAMKNRIEQVWNSSEVLIKPMGDQYERPAVTNGPRGMQGGFILAPCPCKGGVKPRVAVDLVYGKGDGTEDWVVNIIWDPKAKLGRSYTRLRRRITTLGSFAIFNHPYDASHEFGHIIGFGHPSGWGSRDRDYNDPDGEMSYNVMGSGVTADQRNAGPWAAELQRRFPGGGYFRPATVKGKPDIPWEAR